MYAIGWLLVASILTEPWLGVVLWRTFRRELGVRDDARVRLYGRIVAIEWSYACLVVASVAGLLHPWATLGFVRPTLAAAPPAVRASLVGIVCGLTLGLLAPVAFARGRAFLRRALGEAGALLPASRRERLYFIAVALSAGVCEELLYRGFLFYWIGRFTPYAWVAVVASAIVFGAAPAYQGPGGVVGTSLLGAGLGAIYLYTGSLWPPIALHALIDLRATLISPSPAGSPSAAGAASDRAAGGSPRGRSRRSRRPGAA